jgi:hypothetical protein
MKRADIHFRYDTLKDLEVRLSGVDTPSGWMDTGGSDEPWQEMGRKDNADRS